MAQSPFLIDQIQLEPGGTGTRLIRKGADNSIEFLDALITGGITLSQLAGFKTMSHVMVVGKSGAGAAYTTIQSALDAIPATCSPDSPYFVFVGPGQYRETLNIVRDGVYIFGMGAVLQSEQEAVPNGPGAYHTVVVQAALGTVPRQVVIRDVIITNVHDNYACVRVAGSAASQVAQQGVRLINCDLRATATGGNHPIWSTSANHIWMQGGSMQGSDGLALIKIENCASFLMDSVAFPTALYATYASGGTVPSETPVGYFLRNCESLAYGSSVDPHIESTLTGAGTLRITGCTGTSPTATFTGRSVIAEGSDLGALTLDTCAVTLSGCRRGSVATSGGATLAEPTQVGVVVLAAEATKAVTFGVPHPDDSYRVSFELPSAPASGDIPWVTLKTVAGFTINFAHAQTMTVSWAVSRTM